MKYLLVVPDKDKWSYPEKNNNKVVWSCQLPGCFFSLYDYWLCCDNGFRHGSGIPALQALGPSSCHQIFQVVMLQLPLVQCALPPVTTWQQLGVVLSCLVRPRSWYLHRAWNWSQAINAPLLELRRATSATSARVRRALRRAACNASGENWHPVMGWLVVFWSFFFWVGCELVCGSWALHILQGRKHWILGSLLGVARVRKFLRCLRIGPRRLHAKGLITIVTCCGCLYTGRVVDVDWWIECLRSVKDSSHSHALSPFPECVVFRMQVLLLGWP